MRVLLVNDRPLAPGSGTEVHMIRLRDALVQAGHEVAAFAGEVEHHGPAKPLDVWDPVARRKLVRVAADFRPDVVHHHNVVRELSASVLGAPRGTATVLTVHDHRLLHADEGVPMGRPLRLAKEAKGVLDRAVVRRRVDIVIAVSADLARKLRAAGMPDVRNISYFVPDELAGEPGPLGTHVLSAGRLSKEKGVDDLIEAFGRVAPDVPGADLVIAGDGPERAALEALAARLAPGRVRFTGLIGPAELAALTAEAAVVAAPSLVPETGPLVTLEAMVAGRAVIGSDWPTFRERIGDDERGLIVPRGDVDALAAALRRLLTDRPLAERLAAAARAHGLAHHTAGAVVPAIVEVYREAIARHG